MTLLLDAHIWQPRLRTVTLASVTVLACVAWSSTATGQRVRGTVRDSASALPIPGAVVSMLDSGGRASQRVLTDRAGHYLLAAAPGFDRLQVLHVGHLPRTLRLPAPGPDGIVTVDVKMASVALVLNAIHTKGGALCPAPADQAAAVALWEQARAGLLAAAVARDANVGQLQLLVYHRNLAFDDGHVLDQALTSTDVYADHTFTAARAPADFARLGYLQRFGGRAAAAAIAAPPPSGVVFLGPDLDVLLDESFAAGHCFRLAGADAAHPGQVGIGFVPVGAASRLIDIAGILWLDSRTPQLRTVEYGYTNVALKNAGSAMGGIMTFRSLPNGIPILERWIIRTSPASDARSGSVDGGPRNPPTAIGKADVETGAELISATWPDSVSWHATLGRLTGQLRSPVDHAPLAGVRVSLTGTTYTTVADSLGAFAFDGLLPGKYSVLTSDDGVSAFGLVQNADKATMANIRRAADTAIVINIRSAGSVVRQICGARLDSGTTYLLARIVQADGSPPPSSASLSVRGRRAPRVRPLAAPGTFAVCGIPAGVTDTLAVLIEGHATTFPRVPQAGRGVDTTTLRLGRGDG